jgi:hypothetical protein
MKNTITFLLFSVLLVSCKQAIRDKDINKLNGYWEIEKVNFPSGVKKEYKVNETIDFFKISENKGFRQKVMPQFDGSYLTNGIKENITISKDGSEVYIYYATNYGKWKEEIIEIRDSIMVLKNDANLEYHYKRQVPFSLK